MTPAELQTHFQENTSVTQKKRRRYVAEKVSNPLPGNHLCDTALSWEP